MDHIVFATNNAHKLSEVRQMLDGIVEVLSLADIDCHDDIPETANTLEGNALQKAQWVFTRYGYDCFADDTGLEVDCLNSAPGVFSARYAGEGHNDNANKRKLLADMKDAANRQAQFRTVVALIEAKPREDNNDVDSETHCFEGIVRGQLLEKERGAAGFGYDPLFVPDGHSMTFAQMTAEQKNAISHRAMAVAKLVDYLKNKQENK